MMEELKLMAPLTKASLYQERLSAYVLWLETFVASRLSYWPCKPRVPGFGLFGLSAETLKLGNVSI